MYKEVDGDLIKMALKGKFDVIAHGCNCFCNMGAGIAKSIREVFPEAYEADKKTKYGDYEKMGNFTFAVSEINTPHQEEIGIFNLYTQYGPGTPSPGSDIPLDYEALTLALRKMNAKLAKSPYKKVGLPKIGAGLAMGDWDRISKIIEENTPDLEVVVVNFVPEPKTV